MIEKNFEGVSVRWVIALKGEAEEIIKNYAMKRVATTPFPVYKNKDLDMWLILSGIGQLNAVAATSYLYVKSDASYNTIWINFGIVGSRNFKVGELIQIDKITSSDFQDNYYPSPSAFKNNNIQRGNLITVNKPEKLFENNNLKIRVVSMSSFELFEKNDDGYKNEILGNKPIFAIEAGVINGWEKYIKNENFVGMSTFGESGPYKDLYKHFKITDDYLIEKIIKSL